MKFEFARTTDVTKYALSDNFGYTQNGYSKIFVCPDVWDTHVLRILEGFNEDYEECENKVLVEWNQIPHDYKGQNIDIKRLDWLLEEDSIDLSNWDYKCYNSIEDAIESIDQGYGINK